MKAQSFVSSIQSGFLMTSILVLVQRQVSRKDRRGSTIIKNRASTVTAPLPGLLLPGYITYAQNIPKIEVQFFPFWSQIISYFSNELLPLFPVVATAAREL